MSKIKVVVMGGGNGTAITIQALKQSIAEFEISAVVSVSDSGGSSGSLRKQFGVLPPGDILRAVLAMSGRVDYPVLKKIFRQNRFADVGKLNGHNLGNLFLVFASQYGCLTDAIGALEQAIEAVGHVYPVTLDSVDLVGKLDNGQIVKTEGALDRPNYDRDFKIKEVWLDPEAKIYQEASKAIEQADHIFFGPGSLFCSIIATLLPKGVKEAIDRSKAKLIYTVGNAFEADGETGPTRLSGFISQLENYLPRKLDAVVYNSARLNNAQFAKYRAKKWNLIKFDKNHLSDYHIVDGDYEKGHGGLCEKKLGKILLDLVKTKL